VVAFLVAACFNPANSGVGLGLNNNDSGDLQYWKNGKGEIIASS